MNFMTKICLLLVSQLICYLTPWANDLDFQNLLVDIGRKVDAQATSGASKRLETSMGAPAIVKVFTQKEIQRYESIYDLIKTVPGVRVEEGPLGIRFIQIRNVLGDIINNKVLVVVNGFKLADTVTGHFDLDAIPTNAIKRLEFIRGAGSVLYGSNAFSGVISIVTFDGNSYEKNSFGLDYGTDSTSQLELKVFERERLWKHFFAARLSNEDGTEKGSQELYNYHQRLPNGYAPLLGGQPFDRAFPSQPSDFRDDQLNYSVLGVSQFRDLKMTFSSSRVFQRLSYNEANPTPFWGNIFAAANPLAAGVSFFDPGRVREHMDWRTNFFGTEYKHQMDERTQLRVLGKYSEITYTSNNFDKNLFKLNTEGHSSEVEVQLIRQVNDKLNFTLGFQREWLDYSQFTSGRANIAAASAILSPAFGSPMIPGDYFSVAPCSLKFSGVYFQGEYQINESWKLLVANRRNEHDFVGDGYTPKYALIHKLDDDEYLKFIYGRAFRYPTPFELFVNLPLVNFAGSTQLREEKVESREINWLKRYHKGNRQLSLTLFDLQLTQAIDTVNTFYANLGVTRVSKGLELEWDEKLCNRLELSLNYTRQWFEDPKGTTNKGYGIAHHLFNLGLEYKLSDRYSLYSENRFVGSRPEAPSLLPGEENPAYWVHDIVLSYRHSKGKKLRLKIENVFDRNQHSNPVTISSPKLVPGLGGRKFIVQYRVNF